MYSITNKGYEYLEWLRARLEGEYGRKTETRTEERRDFAILGVLAEAPRDAEWEQGRLPEEYQIRLRGLVRQGYIEYTE